MKIQTTQLLTASLAVHLSFSVIAEEVIAEKVMEKDSIEEEIIVTATRDELPLKAALPTAHVITALDIERLQPRDLPSLLGRVSGVDFRDSGGRGSTSGVFIRGTTSSQIIVLIDGVRSSSATTGATPLENIPLTSIERIEIVKGPLSGLYGADALGGVIQVFTKKGTSSDLTGSLRASYGSHDFQDYTATMSAGSEDHQFLLSLSKEDTDGIDRTELKTDGNEDKDSFKEKSGNLSASFTLTDKLKAQLNYLRSEGRSEFDNTFGADLGSFSDNEMESTGVKLIYHSGDMLKLSLDLGYLSDRMITPVFSSDFHTRRNSAAIQGDIQLNAENQLTIGVDKYTDDVATLSAFPETERDNKGYFLQWQGYRESVKMVTNLRYDDNEAYGSDTNGSVALSFALGENLEMVGSYGTAFKAPSFNELYFPFYGNPDVEPEETETFELSLKGGYETMEWRISIYQNDVDNLIGFDLSTFTANNIASATLEGVELEASLTLAEWQISGNIDYLEARDDATNEWLDDRALVSANLSVARQFNQWYLGIDAQSEHGRHDSGGLDLPGFTIWGLSTVYDIDDNLKISGRVDNLFNKDYSLNLYSSSGAYETEGTVARVSIEYRLN